MAEEEDVHFNGKIIAGPQKVTFRPVGGGNEGNTIPKSIIDALRIKTKNHRFLNLTVIMNEEGRRILIVETSKE